jgi:MinD superfamily P-loop ATPase
MLEILILSGKGGTGKTTITASLAHTATMSSQNPIICDLDVDAPDLHLLLKPNIQTTHEFLSGNEARVRVQDCTGCGECIDPCRFDAMKMQEGVAQVDPFRCEGCKVCVTLCPAGAIDFPTRYCGDWYESTCRFGRMVHAQLFPGQENSGRLVALLRQKARTRAQEIGSELIISDGPPGIGCPVISSLSGTDLALIITEPTQSGLHDLKRVVDLCNHFRVPLAVVLNKHDLNPAMSRKVEEYCQKNWLHFIGRLPHSPKVVESMLAGQSISEQDPQGLGATLRKIWAELMEISAEARAA